MTEKIEISSDPPLEKVTVWTKAPHNVALLSLVNLLIDKVVVG